MILRVAAVLCAVCFCGALQAEKIVQCITNFPIPVDAYTQALQKRGYDGKVIQVDVREYDEQLLIKKNPFYVFLKKVGLDFLSRVDLPVEVDKIVFFNISPKVVRKYALSRLPKEKLVLFMWEPKTVLKRMYDPEVQACFSRIYTWDDSLVDGKTYFKFNYPVFRPMLEEIPSFGEKKLCTMVASNLASSADNELYSERKEVVRYFEEAGEEGFAFYGRKWDPSLYKTYQGTIGDNHVWYKNFRLPIDKLNTIKNFRFTICYENTHGTPGYITEKIFDCFAAGTVPIYWGASNVEDYIPKGCFIDRREFSSMEELHRFIKAMPKETYEGYLDRIRSFLLSGVVETFTFDHLLDIFCDAVLCNLTDHL